MSTPISATLPRFHRSTITRVLRPIPRILTALVIMGGLVLMGEGVGTLRGMNMGLYAANVPASDAVFDHKNRCEASINTTLSASNPDGYRLTRGFSVPGKSLDDVAAHRFAQDHGRALATCLMDGSSVSSFAQINHLMASVALRSSTFNAPFLPPLSPEQRADDQALVQRLQQQTDATFITNILTKAALADQMKTMCHGFFGQVRCVPVRVGAAANVDANSGITPWDAFLHPERLIEALTSHDVLVASNVDTNLWQLSHPDAMRAYDHAMVTDGLAVAATRAAREHLDPTPIDALRTARQTQADALIQGFALRAKDLS